MSRAVLTFHSIDDRGSVLSFPPRAFARLVEQIARADIPVMSFEDLMKCDTGVTITFDDGMQSVFTQAWPVLQAYGFPAHVFLTTGSVSRDNCWPSQPAGAPTFAMLRWDEIEACAGDGMLVESHTKTHPDLRLLSAAEMLDECHSADDEIERHIGRRPRLMAYPYGGFNNAVSRAVGPLYNACFTTRLAYLDARPRLAEIPRIDSYYLRTHALHWPVLGTATRRYIAIRSWIRTLRGTQ